jgi:plastocyanin
MRKPIICVLALVALTAAACGEDDPDVIIVEEDDDPTVVGETPGECIELSATDGAPAAVSLFNSYFDPACFSMSSTQGISLANAGDVEHNFSIRNTEVDLDLDPGEELTTEAIGDIVDFGTYTYYCEYHESEGMVGVLTIE